MLLNYFTRSYSHFKIKMLASLLAVLFLAILVVLMIKYDSEENTRLDRLELMTKRIEKEFSKIMKLDQELSSQLKVLENQIQG